MIFFEKLDMKSTESLQSPLGKIVTPCRRQNVASWGCSQ